MNQTAYPESLVRPRRGVPDILFFEELDDEPAPLPVSVAAPVLTPPAPPPLGDADLARARAEGFAHGSSVAHDAAMAAREQATSAALTRIAEALDIAGGMAAQSNDAAATALARLLLGCMARLLPALCAHHGAAEAATLARAILPGLTHEALATVRVHPQGLPALQAALATLDDRARPRLELVGSDALALGDLRIEWPDGAAVRDTAAIWATVRDALAALGLADPDHLNISRELQP